MELSDKTAFYTGDRTVMGGLDDTAGKLASSQVTIFDGTEPPRLYLLNRFGKDMVYFGRDPRNDIVLSSPIASAFHGRFIRRGGVWSIEDKAAYQGQGSTNGLIYNNCAVTARVVADGDFIRIDDGVEPVPSGVLFVFTAAGSGNQWRTVPLNGKPTLTIGREEGCDIQLPHISVSKRHAWIAREADGFYLYDHRSTNGVIVNGRRVRGRIRLHDKDIISITNSKLIFTSTEVHYCCFRSGISVDAADVVIRRGHGRRSFITCNHVSLNIRPGELVAIIGGSGAGKSTILNCLCGYLKPAEGSVYINGISLYQNFDSLKKLIGYVPQSDIVYDNLTLYDMLAYTARLRLPRDTTPQEREAAIDRAIQMVELTEKRGSLIRSLSGGQRKRASIAVELLSDPNLLFLDEPASGLDPGTERNLMQSLRRMACNGKTVILVTHSTLQLKLCDKIVFMGKGGNLCFYGSYDEALKFFGVSDVVDVYNMITEQAPQWSARFRQVRPPVPHTRPAAALTRRTEQNIPRQLGVLCGRYLKLVTNDRQRLLLLLVQAPLLAALISLVADGNQFEQYEMTKSLLFALSCSAFWVGMLNAIQEVCKERSILKREYMTGLSLTSYLMSKILVLGLLCLVQSLMIVTVFSLMVGLPEEGLIMFPYLELLITAFLTAVASAAMGLFVSSLFTNADRAMTVAPLLLMPQILFSGLIFKLDGATEIISWFAVCRWSMEGFGTTANLNDLPMKLQQQGIMIPHEAEDFFDFTVPHMLLAWAILVVFVLGFLALARLVLARISKESA
ncbi:ATP-binding cassette domain-containing protein [uncultured Gemmiger sp.]|uniref:ATP-binding cassette domain-containing protein n=1 Tax=uncultured Gemmiger sp. TaxID=1623490 RepID=UPI0025FFBB11|nr:ATP-binding cassette domain-containing protein [uncultured Gemmiger sp.]